MEILLLLIIILLLLLRLKSINEKLDLLHSNFLDLKISLSKLTGQNTEPVSSQPITQSKDAAEVDVTEDDVTEDISTEDISTEDDISEDVVDQPEPPPFPFEIANEFDLNELEDITEPIIPETTYQKVHHEPITPQKTWWMRFREQNPDLEKFVGENLISKIGVLILVLGISYFVKFAIDNNWINETARVGIGILSGAIVMGFAHKLRTNYKAFSSVLVAGAIAILYFTIAIAFHQYHLFNQTLAFILMVIITAFSVLISVSYDRMELAILSLIGGFAVPFMLSTGDSNYQILFTYVALLDIGIMVIAYMKRWSLVNIVAFAFTVLLFGGWLGTEVVPIAQAPYYGAFIFATLFYIIFTFTSIINNVRTKGLFSKLELLVINSNTFLYFASGMIIFSNFHPEFKGLFTISLALFNLICAWILYKKFGLDKNAIYLLLGLTLTFATLAIPLQFKGNYITLFWAAEAVLLLWLSQKSTIQQFRFASIIVHFLMLMSLVLDWNQIYSSSTNIASIIVNGGFIAGIIATISLVTAGVLTRNETERKTLFSIHVDPADYQTIVKILSVFVLYLTGFLETQYQSNQFYHGAFSPVSITIAYHLAFSALLVFFIQKHPTPHRQKFAVGFSLVNIVMYVLFFSMIPFGEFRENLGLISTSTIAFSTHYISLLCIIYVGYIVWKDGKTIDSLSIFKKKWFIWLAAFAMVYISSNEVLLHGIRIIAKPVYSALKDSNLAYINYENASTFMMKVVFPILWGVLVFLFLTIGIKKQNRNLRIVALTLLGITIVKLFVYDISNVSETGKIIAFILLGVMILIMSFAYQNIRKIVLEIEKPTDIENDKK